MNRYENLNERELWENLASKDLLERVDSYRKLSSKAYFDGRYKESLEMGSMARDLLLENGRESFHKEIASILGSMTEILEIMKDLPEALNTIDEAIAICKEYGDEDIGSYIRYKGRLYFKDKKYEESLACHKESLELPDIGPWEHSLGVDYLNIGMSLNRLGRYSEAEEPLLKAIDSFLTEEEDEDERPNWVMQAYGEIVETYVGLNNGEQILFFAQPALDWWENQGVRRTCWWLKYYLAIGNRLRGEAELALTLLEDARNRAIVDGMGQESAFLAKVGKERGQILIEKGEVDEGLELIRRSESVEATLDLCERKGD